MATLILWLARPALFPAASGGSWPVPGLVFLPFTALMYVLLWSPAGLVGRD